LTLPQAMRNWLDPHHDLFPRDIIYPPDQSADEVEQQNTAEMTGSQDSAVAAALQAANVPFHTKVSTVADKSPAEGKLKPGDIVLAVDGQPVTQVPQVGEFVRKHKVGEDVVFLIRRGTAEQTVALKTAATPGEETRPMVGITIGVDSQVKVTVNLGQDIGGPSAGTAFALAIYDKLTPGALLNGKHVAGTGTIDALGQVGAIGGIQQKIAGARNDGATVFLVPAPNCAAALHAGVKDIRLVKISTLTDAISALKAIADGKGEVPSCSQ
jgi:PDZ domain-containing protein